MISMEKGINEIPDYVKKFEGSPKRARLDTSQEIKKILEIKMVLTLNTTVSRPIQPIKFS